MPFVPSITLTHWQRKEYSVVSFLGRVLVADNVSRRRMIASSVANNLSRSEFLFANNLSRKLSCL
jgi:hypothetical protein